MADEEKVMRILQVNLNHCRLAHNLVVQAAVELDVDIVMTSEPLYNPGKWIFDDSNTSAIWFTGLHDIVPCDDAAFTGIGFVGATVNGMTFISTYESPNSDPEAYDGYLERLISMRRELGPRLVIAGDFNAHSPAWGSEILSDRGEALQNALSIMRMVPVESDGGPTFERHGKTSKIDFAAMDRVTESRVRVKQVLDDVYTGSDHKYIIYEIAQDSVIGLTDTIGRRPAPYKRWNGRTLDLGKLTNAFMVRTAHLPTMSPMNSSQIAEYLRAVAVSCEEAMKRVGPRSPKSRAANSWWNDDLKDLRLKAGRARRRMLRIRDKMSDNFKTRQIEYRIAKKTLNRSILAAKIDIWEAYCRELIENPWGRPYQTIMKEVKGNGNLPLLTRQLAEEVLRRLFPATNTAAPVGRSGGTVAGWLRNHSEVYQPGNRVNMVEKDWITEEEVRAAVGKLNIKKAPGLDGVPIIAAKGLANYDIPRLCAVYNGCLQMGDLPKAWKKTRLILTKKEGKDPTTPEAYRPLCIIDGIAKVFEYVVKDRLMEAVAKRGFVKNQFGFAKGRNTTQALYRVGKFAEKWSGSFVALITFDIRNAFNTLSWDVIHAELERRCAPLYLRKIMEGYLSDRWVVYHHAEGNITHQMEMGVPQGSVVGPTLWNLVYDRLLRRSVSQGCEVIGYADDIALLVAAANLENFTKKIKIEVANIKAWLIDVGLKLAEEKTALTLLNNKSIPDDFQITGPGYRLKVQNEVKYLGVIIDRRRTYRTHINAVAGKAARVMAALSRVLPNTGGPTNSGRRLYYLIIEAIMLYGAPLWAKKAEEGSNAANIRRVQKLGLIRVVRAYRTVPVKSLCVLAGFPSLMHVITERAKIFEYMRDEEQSDDATAEELSEYKRRISAYKKTLREKTIQNWEEEWRREGDPWTRRWIPGIKQWLDRKHGDLSFHLTQMLTGHGVFGTFLKKIRKMEEAKCWYGCECDDDAEHTLSFCEHWHEERSELAEQLGIVGSIDPEKCMYEALSSKEKWDALEKYSGIVMKTKEEDERMLKRERRYRLQSMINA